MEENCVKEEVPSDDESAINEEKLFLNSQFKIEPSIDQLESIGHAEQEQEFILPDIEYEFPVNQEGTSAPHLRISGDERVGVKQPLRDDSQADAQTLSAFASAELSLQSSALQAGQPQLPVIAAAAQTQLSHLLGAMNAPPRQGIFLQQLLQNSLSASSTTTNVPRPSTTASAADKTVSLPQVVGVPPQSLFQPQVAAAQTTVLLPSPQHQSQAANQAVAQLNCTTAPQTIASEQQVSNIPPSVEAALRQSLLKAGVNSGIIIMTKPKGVPTIIANHEQLQLLLQQVQLQQAQAQAQSQLQPQVQIKREVGAVSADVPVGSSTPQNFPGTSPSLPLVRLPSSAPAVSSAPTLGSLKDVLGAQIAMSNSLGSSTNIEVPTPVLTEATSSVTNTCPETEDKRCPSEGTESVKAESTLNHFEFVSSFQSVDSTRRQCPTPCPDEEVEGADSGKWDDSSGESDISLQMPPDDEVESDSVSSSSDNEESTDDGDRGNSDWIPGDNPVNRSGSGRGRLRRRGGGSKELTNGNISIDWQRMDGTQSVSPKLPFQAPRKGFLPPAVHPKQEIDYFQLFFSDELIEAMVAETNRYAGSKIQACSPLTQFSQWKDWKDVTVEEMRAFFGFIMNMALSHKPRLQDYFSLEWTVKQDFFTEVFSRQRFYQIFRALHVADPCTNNEPGRHSRSSKIGNMWRYIDAASRKYFAPDEDIVLDVSTVGVKGRIEFKCRNLQKAMRGGLKIYVVKDCKTGFICAMEPFFGQTTMDKLIRPDLPFKARIVLHLISRILKEHPAVGHHVFIDKFFNTVTLARELQKLDTYVTGTITPNRKNMPIQVKDKYLKKMDPDEALWFTADGMVVLALADKSPVVMLSTYHNSTSPCKRRGPDAKDHATKPDMIKDFSAKMGAIGKADNLCPAYEFSIRSHVWWRKLFFWLLEVSVINAYCLFNLVNSRECLKPVNHVVFRKNLIRQLVGNIRNKPTRKRRREATHALERLNNAFHCVGYSKNSRDCVVCSDRSIPGGRKQTKFICSTCSVNPALHVRECFNKYHTEQKYR